MYHGTCGGQRTISFHLMCFWGHSGCGVWQQTPLLAEPSHWPLFVSFLNPPVIYSLYSRNPCLYCNFLYKQDITQG